MCKPLNLVSPALARVGCVIVVTVVDKLHARAMLGPGPGPPHRNLELAGRAVVCTANNQTFKSLTKPSAGPPVREVQAQHRCLHPRQGEIYWLSPGLTLSPCQEFGLKNFSLSLFLCQEFGLKNLRTIHRLDRLTSGLLMFGRNPRKAREMEQQIRNRQVVLRFLLLPYHALSPICLPSTFSLSSLVFYRCRTGAERIRLSCGRRISRGEDRVQPTGGGRQLQDWGLQGEQ